MITDSEELAGQVDPAQAAKVREFNSILERLRVGLIPIRCRLIDYRAVSTAWGYYLIHRRVLDELPPGETPHSEPIYLVGVTEQDLFWKDTRRILFSNAEVRILCRLNKVGTQASWNAVKLADMVGTLLPEFSDMMNSFATDALHAMISNAHEPSADEQGGEVLVTFAELIASSRGITLTDSEVEDVRRISRRNTHHLSSDDLDVRRIAFAGILDHMQSCHGVSMSAQESATLRMQAEGQVGLRHGLALQTSSTAPSSEVETGRFLDSEIIAIYW